MDNKVSTDISHPHRSFQAAHRLFLQEKMSRALGTAFLSHQVSQLEKDIIKGSNNGPQGRGNARGGGRGGRGGARGGSRGGGRNGHPRPQLGAPGQADDNQDSNRPGATQWRSNKAIKEVTQAKVADRIVVDASVLIHALPTVRTWCRDSSKEVVIIPLEGKPPVLNLSFGESMID